MYTSSELMRISLKIAHDASAFLREYREEHEQISKVRGETFRADILAEELIIEELGNQGFEGLIVSEEMGVKKLGDDELVAIIDPLDGTINYISGIPWCSVSVAFAVRKEDQPGIDSIIAGTVAPIFYGKSISFSVGEGIFLENEKVSRSHIKSNFEGLGHRIIALYEDDPEAIPSIIKIYKELAEHVGEKGPYALKLRSLGSAAMELAYVGLGKIGYFVDLRARLRIVDVAAGLGIIREAGGWFGDASGNPLVLRVDRVSRLNSLIATHTRGDYDVVLRSLRG